MFNFLKFQGSYRLAIHISMGIAFGLMAGPMGFVFGLLAYGGGGGGDKAGGGAPSFAPPPPPAAPPPPTVDDAQVQADIDATNRRRAAATGLSATDVTKGALAGDPTTLNSTKPTLLGGGTPVERM